MERLRETLWGGWGEAQFPSSIMVHQNPLILTEEKRVELENGGGSKALTRQIRDSIGKNFVEYCETREAMYAENPTAAPDWWKPADPEMQTVRSMEEVATTDNAVILGNYAKSWLWEMQVGFIVSVDIRIFIRKLKVQAASGLSSSSCGRNWRAL